MQKIYTLVMLIGLIMFPELLAQSCTNDTRTPTSHAAVGRLVINNSNNGGGWAPGTAWILPNGKMVTAGHVMQDFLNSGGTIIVEFNVPLSDPNTGQMGIALDEDRYIVDQSTIQMANNGSASGDDWCVFEVQPNSVTGLTPIEAQNASIDIKQDFPLGNIKIIGYGREDDPNNQAYNYASQGNTGSYLGSAYNNTYFKFNNYVIKGVSGAPLIDKVDGKAVGIVTARDCDYFGYNGGTSFFNNTFWQAAGVVHVVVEQRKADGTVFGNIDHWEIVNGSYEFKAYPSGQEFILSDGSQETFKAQQDIVDNQKYHDWNSFNDVTNHHTFNINFNTSVLVAKFLNIDMNIQIRNVLVAAEVKNQGEIYFKDPWLIDHADPAFNNAKRNQGMAAPFKARPVPFIPDTATSYGGEVYQGVFLNQNYSGSMPYYSLASPPQNISFHGQTITWYLDAWEGDADSVAFSAPDADTTAVVFKQPGATVTARLKGHLVSNTNGGMRYVVQRHLTYQNGKWYAVYRDGGRIYVTYSSDGSTWSREHRVSGVLENCDHAHIAAGMESGYVYIVWERALGNRTYEVYFSRTTDGGASWSTPQLMATVTTSYYQAYGPQPVIAEMRTLQSGIEPNGAQSTDGTNAPPPTYDYHLVLVYVTDNGLKWRYSSDHGSSWGNVQSLSVPSPTTVWFPSIASGTDFLALAYSFRSNAYEVTSRIFDGSNWSNAADVSGIAGRLYDRQPSIAVTRNGDLICGWHAHDSNGQYRVLLRRGYADNTWQSLVEEMMPHSSVHESHPSVTYWNDNEVDVVWFDTNHNIYRRQYSNGFNSYIESIISTNGLHANLPQLLRDDYVNSVLMWTEKTGAPYLLKSSAGVQYTTNATLSQITPVIIGRTAIISNHGWSQHFELANVRLDDTDVNFVSLPQPMPVKLTSSDVGEYVRTERFSVQGQGVLYFTAGVSSDGGVMDSVAVIESTVSNSPAQGFVELVQAESGKVVYKQVVGVRKDYQLPVALLGNGHYYLRLVVTGVSSNSRIGLRENRQAIKVESLSSSEENVTVLPEKLLEGVNLEVPEQFTLYPAYPNPFNPSTTIRYGLPAASEVVLEVYNVQGQRVRRLVAGHQTAGWHEVVWDGRGDHGQRLGSGVYVLRLTARPEKGSAVVESRKVVLVK